MYSIVLTSIGYILNSCDMLYSKVVRVCLLLECRRRHRKRHQSEHRKKRRKSTSSSSSETLRYECLNLCWSNRVAGLEKGVVVDLSLSPLGFLLPPLV